MFSLQYEQYKTKDTVYAFSPCWEDRLTLCKMKYMVDHAASDVLAFAIIVLQSDLEDYRAEEELLARNASS